MEKRFDEDAVLKILALALDDDTPNHRICYLLQKIYGKDSLVVLKDKKELLLRIKLISKDLK